MQIIFRRPWPSLKHLRLAVEAGDSIDTVLAKIAEITESPAEQFKLAFTFGGDFLKRGKTLSDYKISEGGTVWLWQQFDIVIEPLSGNTFTLNIDASHDIQTVKHTIEYLEDIDYKCIRLVVGTTVMDQDNKCVLAYGLKAGSRVQLFVVPIRMRNKCLPAYELPFRPNKKRTHSKVDHLCVLGPSAYAIRRRR